MMLRRAETLVGGVLPADAAVRLAAARRGRERGPGAGRGVGQAREPHARPARSRCAADWSTSSACRRERPHVAGIVSATRGNHGQSLAYAGRAFGVPVVDPRAARQQPREERRDARLRRRADRARPRLPGGARARRRSSPAERGFEMVPPFHRRPRLRCRDVRARAVPAVRGPRRGVRAGRAWAPASRAC